MGNATNASVGALAAGSAGGAAEVEDVDVVDDVDVVEGCVVVALGSGGGFGSAGKGPCSPSVVSSENIP